MLDKLLGDRSPSFKASFKAISDECMDERKLFRQKSKKLPKLKQKFQSKSQQKSQSKSSSNSETKSMSNGQPKANSQPKKLKKRNSASDKLVNDCQVELDSLTQELYALQNEVSELKSELSNKNQIIDDVILHYAISEDICTVRNADSITKARNILKLEKEVFQLENNLLLEEVNKFFNAEDKKEKEHEKAIASLSKEQFQEIQNMHGDFQKRVQLYSSKVLRLEHELRSEKAKHEVNVRDLKQRIKAVSENSETDKEFVTVCVKNMRETSKRREYRMSRSSLVMGESDLKRSSLDNVKRKSTRSFRSY